jgi:AmmeMemoRadiSam system protein B
MPNTRFSRCAHVIAARRCTGMLFCCSAETLGLAPFPRFAGVTDARCLLFGANTPWNRVRFTRGLGTRAASRAMKSSGQNQISDLPQVKLLQAAHASEHSLEVQLPFLQLILADFKLVPLVVGDASGEEVAEVLERLWGGPETLIVISSDLSHYHDYLTAQQMDRNTSDAIVTLRPEAIGYEDACGRIPVQGLLTLAKRQGLQGELIDLRNSGDTAGPRDQVVGYGAYTFSE